MIATLRHISRITYSIVREHAKKVFRSSKWSGVRKQFLNANPMCAACGSIKFLQIHHRLPFALHPEEELDPKNLVTLCMDKPECHLHIGHSGSFHMYNPNLSADILNIKSGFISLEQAIIEAKKNAKPL